MSFNLNIRNFGKLDDAVIDIGRFTVLAGPNNTGKSTVSKLLYSVFDGVNANHASIYLNDLFGELHGAMLRIFARTGKIDSSFPALTVLEKKLIEIDGLIESVSDKDRNDLDDSLQNIKNLFVELREVFCENRVNLREFLSNGKKTISSWEKSFIERMMHDVERALKSIEAGIDDLDGDRVVRNGMTHKINENFVHNFQTSTFSSLKSVENEDAVVSIDGIGTIRLAADDSIEFDILEEGFNLLQDYSRVIYLESPIYWKLKDALEKLKLSPRFRILADRERLDGVPGYFYDLASVMREKYSGDIAFPELFEKLVSGGILAGRIAITDNGDLTYRQGEREFSLHLTAMGVVNVGILALLIERKILDEGSFLFIDEPEAHLHPAWQVQMAEVLFELARQGVYVVLATHSLNFLKWLEVHVKQHPEDRELVALNRFSPDGVESGVDFDELVSSIKDELSAPFSKLFVQGI